MTWLQRELDWGVEPTELRHLSGRIGELYAAMITNGRMATDVNQKGYDVVSAQGERISVKTTAQMGNGASFNFNGNTLDKVDRVICLRLNTDEMQIETLLDESVQQAKERMRMGPDSKLVIPISSLMRNKRPKIDIPSIKEVTFDDLLIRELESGTIEVIRGDLSILPAKPELRRIAEKLGVDIFNENGNPRNTRQLGSLLIQTIQKKKGTDADQIISP